MGWWWEEIILPHPWCVIEFPGLVEVTLFPHSITDRHKSSCFSSHFGRLLTTLLWPCINLHSMFHSVLILRILNNDSFGSPWCHMVKYTVKEESTQLCTEPNDFMFHTVKCCVYVQWCISKLNAAMENTISSLLFIKKQQTLKARNAGLQYRSLFWFYCRQLVSKRLTKCWKRWKICSVTFRNWLVSQSRDV